MAILKRLAETGRPALTFTFDGQACTALAGDTVLTAVLTQAERLRVSEFGGGPRAGFCMMGACQDCWVQHEDGGRLVYRGRVGSGFTQRMLQELRRALEPLARREPPVVNPALDPEPGAVHWVEPVLVAEVEFNSWTDDDLVRQEEKKKQQVSLMPADLQKLVTVQELVDMVDYLQTLKTAEPVKAAMP